MTLHSEELTALILEKGDVLSARIVGNLKMFRVLSEMGKEVTYRGLHYNTVLELVVTSIALLTAIVSVTLVLNFFLALAIVHRLRAALVDGRLLADVGDWRQREIKTAFDKWTTYLSLCC